MSLLSVAVSAQSASSEEAVGTAALQQRAQARDQERADIRQERQAIEARQKEQEAACWQRFAVEDCLRNARQTAREQEQPLRQRELDLMQQERHEKANERMRLIEEKQRERSPAPIQVIERRSLSTAAQGVNAARTDGTQPAAQTKTDIAQARAERAAQAKKRAAKLEQTRQNKAVERRARVKQSQRAKQQKEAERRVSKQVQHPPQRAKPLPVPEGTSTSSE